VAQRPRPVAREPYVFGSLARIELVAPPARARAVLDDVERTLDVMHRDWHPWEPSALTALNAALAEGRPHRTPPTLLALIAAARPHVAASDGRFDPAVGGLVALWGFHTSDWPITSPEPDAAAIERWRAARPRLDDVHVAGELVSSGNRAVQLDFNAIAEGMATRTIVATLAAHEVRAALIALGGDVHALGARGARGWNVAVRDPDRGALATVVLADGESLYASGGYGRYREGAAGRLPHLLDPRTGHPARGLVASAVLVRDPVLADAAATALVVAGPREWHEVAARMGIACALVVDEAGVVHATRAFAARAAWSTTRTIKLVGSAAPCDATPSDALPHRPE